MLSPPAMLRIHSDRGQRKTSRAPLAHASPLAKRSGSTVRARAITCQSQTSPKARAITPMPAKATLPPSIHTYGRGDFFAAGGSVVPVGVKPVRSVAVGICRELSVRAGCRQYDRRLHKMGAARPIKFGETIMPQRVRTILEMI